RPLVTGRIPNVTTDGAGNASFIIPLDLPAGVSSGVINCTATDSVGNTSEFSACLAVSRSSQQIQVTVQTNPAGRAFTVDGPNYSATQTFNWVPSSTHTISTTSPQSGGTGNQYVWNSWSDNGAISHNVAPSSNATFTANFTLTAVFNPLEDRDYFVNQHYRDFLDRDADAAGLAYWSDQLAACGSDATCYRKRRIGVSAAFFVELEFQRTGSFVYRLFKGGLARRPTYQEFNTDRAQVREGATLEADKQALTLVHVQRNEFVQKYAGQTTAATFVDPLIAAIQQASNLDISNQRAALITKYGTGANLNQSRALVLRDAIESQAFVDKEYNAAFV